jgi:restriction system protein
LQRRRETTYVQCKQWRARKIDVRPVRELYGVMTAGAASHGILISAGRFTSAAESEASDNAIQLIGGGNLLRLLGNAPEAGPELGTATLAGSRPPPECPRCGKQMIARQARRGRTPGAMFWGCPGFPDCRGTREFN